ncbi:retrovirus-related pol polyprotein from type-1 retrotransposable element r2 [Plakobranchus ocellatus]|uniref:Retrovirus-related pol polyprotein from type-1 retrotransposable element r2 n=1 Tax=Plakobranchus ocellatus TaxID=259542 RepID=A0AAV4DCY3_9GAST|nr:retrovirus-related pol polyprotein from type-1 retrotransposable element r2 [Plakobranchus ocellatus]
MKTKRGRTTQGYMGQLKAIFRNMETNFNMTLRSQIQLEATTPGQPTTLTSSPDKEEIPQFLDKEMKETLDEMKKKKAPGNDITSNKIHEKVYNEVIKNCEKDFDSVEHAAIVQALRKVNINENYVTKIENIYKGATARIHIDNQISDAFEIQRGVRQGDPISPKLFITVIEPDSVIEKPAAGTGLTCCTCLCVGVNLPDTEVCRGATPWSWSESSTEETVVVLLLPCRS